MKRHPSLQPQGKSHMAISTRIALGVSAAVLSFFLSLLLFASCIARIPRGLALLLKGDFASRGLLLFARKLRCRGGRQLFLLALLLGLGGFARQFGLGALNGQSLSLGLPLLDRGI